MLHFLLLLLLACGLAALFNILKGALASGRQWPPGPPALPLIGHLHLLGPLPHQSLCNLSKRYGPLLGLRFGRTPTIIASSPDMAKAILQTNDLAFAFRPACAASVHMFLGGASLGFVPYGPLFRRLRQLLASELLSSRVLKSSRHVREEEARELLRSVLQMVREKPHTPVELRASLLAASNNINCRMATGKRMREICSGMSRKEDLLGLVKEVMYLLGVFNVGDFIPWLARLDPQGYVKRMKAAGQRANVVMQAVIDERREAHKARAAQGDPNDLLDAMLQAASQNPHQHNITTPITNDNIKGVLMDLFIGGSETSSSTVEWALADLINNPTTMQKAQDELDRVVGKARLVEEADIESLPYLASVLKESMRLHPVAPLLIPHEATQACQIYGYTIPSQTRAYVNTWAIGRDPSIWERPLDFWPERFEKGDLDLRGQHFELLPFGYGRRKCPGMALGLLNVQLVLATLVQGCTWSVTSSDNPNIKSPKNVLDMSEMFEMALVMAKPLSAFVTPRLSPELY